MNWAEFGPGQWDHAAGAVQLHCATPERDHCMCETEVF